MLVNVGILICAQVFTERIVHVHDDVWSISAAWKIEGRRRRQKEDADLMSAVEEVGCTVSG